MIQEHTDHKGRPLVAITGIGVVTSLGVGATDNWSSLTAGRSGIRAIQRFATDGLKTTIAGTVDAVQVTPYAASDLATAIAECAMREALAQAALGVKGTLPARLIIATPPSELEWPQLHALFAAGDPTTSGYGRLLDAARRGSFAGYARHVRFGSIAHRLQDTFGTRGAPLSVCTACASGATTLQLGAEAIRRGDLDAAICVATDATVHPEGLIRFSLLSALSSRNDVPQAASRPFSKDRDGFVMAEGAGALVLENYDRAVARGARILAILRGCGEKADHYHRTRSDPTGAAIIAALNKTLEDAGLKPEEIKYINAHGTSTPENDKMEYLALRAVLGDHLDAIPISSNKSMIGHTLIAAGAVEAVFSVLTMQSGTLPPNINYQIPDPELHLDVVANVKRSAEVGTVLSNSFGFGGQNVCVALSLQPG